MGLIESLRDGSLGAEMLFPSGIKPKNVQGNAAQTSFQFGSPQGAVAWWVFHFSKVTLDLSDNGWPTLKRDVERHTRALFEETFGSGGTRSGRRDTGPRTADPTWSRVVEIERSPLAGGSSLYVLHRMAYEPGSEAQFPDHPLSTAREARRWLATDVRIPVLRPAWRDTRTAVDVPAIGYAIVPPNRFSIQSIDRGPRGLPCVSMSRASFSGTDGLDSFFMHSLPAPRRARWVDGGGDSTAVWIFQVGTAITTATNASVVMAGGGKPGNVFWQVGSSATIGTATAFQGNLLAYATVTLVSGSSIVGRALALNAAVTLDNNSISLAN